MKSTLALVLAALVVVPAAVVAGAVGPLNSFANGALADATHVNANFAAVKAAVDDNDGRLDTLEALESIQSATLQSGWTTYGGSYAPAAFYKDRGRVFLRGLVKSGSGGACIFTLPAGYRPAYQTIHAIQTSNTIGRVDVRTDGCVYADVVSANWVSLDNISFRVAP